MTGAPGAARQMAFGDGDEHDQSEEVVRHVHYVSDGRKEADDHDDDDGSEPGIDIEADDDDYEGGIRFERGGEPGEEDQVDAEVEAQVLLAEETFRAARADCDRAALMASMVEVSRTAQGGAGGGGGLREAAAQARMAARGHGSPSSGGAAMAGMSDDEDEVDSQGVTGKLEEGEWVDSDDEDVTLAAADSAESEPSRDEQHFPDETEPEAYAPHHAQAPREPSSSASTGSTGDSDLDFVVRVLVRAVGKERLDEACHHLATRQLDQGIVLARGALGKEHEHLMPLVQRIVVSRQALR
jgi:hypothetical protein